MFSKTLHHVSANSSMISLHEISEDSVDIVMEVDEINQITQNFLSNQYFGGVKLDLESVDFEEVIYLPGPGARVTATSIFDMTEVYSEGQKELLVPFTEHLMSLEDPMLGKESIALFNDRVLTAEVLTKEEKVQLIEYGAGFQAMLGFFESGGVDQLHSKIYGENPDGRIQDCRVNMRDVWAGAIIGLSLKAAVGGWIGATAGTFTVPVLGTAVGGVGGAVFGGAVGFVEGAMTAVAASLLLTCGRPKPKQRGYTSTSCKKMARKGLKLPSVCYRNITYRSHKKKFKTRYKLKGGK